MTAAEPADPELEALQASYPGILSKTALAKTIAEYNSSGTQVASIDVFADNYTPGVRDFGLAWDRTLFYTLEDVDPDSDADCMTKWRVVSGGVQTNFVLGDASANEGYNPEGSVYQYGSMDSDQQAAYDQEEKRRINAAYNTYYFVQQAESISEITGYVYDENGSPLSGASVIIRTADTEEELYEVQSGADGLYRIQVPAVDNSRYQLCLPSVCRCSTPSIMRRTATVCRDSATR